MSSLWEGRGQGQGAGPSLSLPFPWTHWAAADRKSARASWACRSRSPLSSRTPTAL